MLAENELATSLLPLVNTETRRLKYRRFDRDELRSTAYLAALTAIRSYKEDAGRTLSSWCWLKVKFALTELMEEKQRESKRFQWESLSSIPEITLLDRNQVYRAWAHGEMLAMLELVLKLIAQEDGMQRKMQMFDAHVFQGQTLRDVGKQFGVSESAVSHAATEIRKRLREELCRE